LAENCYKIERPTDITVNFKDLTINLDKNLTLHYKIRIGDYENPVGKFKVKYHMYDNGDNTTTCRRNVYDFVQLSNQEVDLKAILDNILPIENQNMINICEELKS